MLGQGRNSLPRERLSVSIFKVSSKTIGLSRHPLENDLGRCIRLQLFRSVELISVIANLPIASVANHFPNLVAKL